MGWQRQPHTWNDASIWSNADGREVLVPSSDGLADTDLRVAEIMSALTAVEGRSADEIAGDINTPFNDVQLYRTFPGVHLSERYSFRGVSVTLRG